MVMRQFHAGYPGAGCMEAIARSYGFWPSIDHEIEDLVKRCLRCQQAVKNPPRQPPIPWPTIQQPWSRLHIDFAGLINRVTRLILVDSLSKWPDIVTFSSVTTTSTIAALQRIFSQHGLPDIIVSNNGSQFSSTQFNDFYHQHMIQHIRSPPYHPQSNGQAERFVDTLKRALLKAGEEGV